LTADGEGSLRNEPGTVRFDLYEDEEQPGRFILLEAYADEAAFDAHMRGPYFAAAQPALESLRNQGAFSARRIARSNTGFIPSAAGWLLEAGSVSSVSSQ